MRRADYQRRPSRYTLPPSQKWGLGEQEYDARRKAAEHGSQRLADAIQRYFERRCA